MSRTGNQTNISFVYVSRKQLQKIIPGLRPWEVLSIEQAMDQITYGGEWYREPLGSYTTGPPYIRHWNKDVKVNTAFYFRFWIIVISFLELYGYVQLLKQNKILVHYFDDFCLLNGPPDLYLCRLLPFAKLSFMYDIVDHGK